MGELEAFDALSSKQVLALAIAMERRNASRYEELGRAIGTDHEPTSILLRELAEEELEHMDVLEAMWRNLYGDTPIGEAAPLDDAIVPELVEFDMPAEGIGEEEVLEAVRQAESAACEFYSAAAKRASDPAVRELCAKMAAIENGHLARATPRPDD